MDKIQQVDLQPGREFREDLSHSDWDDKVPDLESPLHSNILEAISGGQIPSRGLSVCDLTKVSSTTKNDFDEEVADLLQCTRCFYRFRLPAEWGERCSSHKHMFDCGPASFRSSYTTRSIAHFPTVVRRWSFLQTLLLL